MRYTLDCEFIERPCTIDLLSIGLVCEDGREFYAVSSECDLTQANDWVKANVIPKLGDAPPRCRSEIRGGILAFIGADSPTFWGYFSDYDWVSFAWLFGSMIDLPRGWPMLCLDLKQWMLSVGVERHEVPPQDPTQLHNALADARWEMGLLKSLSNITGRRRVTTT